jgi:hypothetical protein
MKLARWVSFQGDYGDPALPDSDGELEGTGIPEVAQLIATGLRSAGVMVEEATDRGGWAYEFGGRFEGLPFEAVVASTDEVRPWVVHIELRHQGFTWLPWRRPKLSPILKRLCEKLHGVIRSEPRAREIRWYTPEGWDRDPDKVWTTAP